MREQSPGRGLWTTLIRRNNEIDSTNSQRFILFIPRSVRLFNRTPMEYKYGSGSSIGGIQEEAALYGTGSRNL